MRSFDAFIVKRGRRSARGAFRIWDGLGDDGGFTDAVAAGYERQGGADAGVELSHC